MADVPVVKTMALGCLMIEAYKCMNDLNVNYLNDLFPIRKCKYEF